MKSWIVVYRRDGRVIRSSRYGVRADAERRVKHLADAGATAISLIPSDAYPEIFPHCPGAGSGPIGSICDICGKVLDINSAKAFRR